MKHLYLFFALFLFAACSKEDSFSDWHLSNGQQVEVLVDHKYGALDDHLTLLPENKTGSLSLYGFLDREPGYIYHIKAKMVVPETPPQDAPAYHLQFVKILSKQKYEGDASFELALIQSIIPGGPMVMLGKENGHYLFRSNIQLSFEDPKVGAQLEEIWQYNKQLQESYQTNKTLPTLKWQAIKATVTHDPANFGKAYLVSAIEFKEAVQP